MGRSAPWSAIIFDYYAKLHSLFRKSIKSLFVLYCHILYFKLAENSEIIAMFSTIVKF